MDTDGLRKKIDDIDAEIRKLFNERLQTSAELAKTAGQSGYAAFDTDTERKKLDAALGKSDPLARGYDPLTSGYDPLARGYDPLTSGYDPLARGYDPLARGYIADLCLRIFELNRSYLSSVLKDTDKPAYYPAILNAGLTEDPFIKPRGAADQAAGVNVKNIALIGMPGCGKTTIGRNLAELLGWEFCDTDEQIIKKAGKDKSRIYAEEGENAYRELETGVITEAVKGRGRVIASGDGVIKREANRELLRRDSTVVFIDRTPSELLSDGMAASDLFALKDIYLERLPLYLDWCDHEVTARGGAVRTAQAIKEMLQRRG